MSYKSRNRKSTTSNSGSNSNSKRRRRSRKSRFGFIPALIIEALAVAGILAVYFSMHADVQSQEQNRQWDGFENNVVAQQTYQMNR